jgi:hypothetical protein
VTAGATVTVGAPEAGARPTALLPMTQLVRISLYWLGLTAIDAAVGQYISFRLVYTDIRGDIPPGTAATLLTVGSVADLRHGLRGPRRCRVAPIA